MKAKRRLGVMLMIVALIIMQLPVSEADAASASDFRIAGNKLEKYSGTDLFVSVPDDIVTVGKSAFENNQYVERVSVPDCVKNIQAYAFWGCDHLKTVSLGKGLTEISDYAFTNCKGLQTLSIPKNIKSIGIQAFADCVNFTDITIPPEVTFIHETAFDGCRKLVIHCEEGSYASKYAKSFYERQLEMPEYEDVPQYEEVSSEPVKEEIAEPEESKPEEAEEVEVPQVENTLGSTHVVGNQAVVFIDNTSLQVFAGLPEPKPEETPETSESGEDSQQKPQEEQIPKFSIVDGKIVADQAYYKNQELGSVALDPGITEIGEFSFARSSVKQLLVPTGVQTIGYGAFYHCDKLETVSLPSTIMNIEPKAFAHTPWVEDFLAAKKDDRGAFLISGGVLAAYRGNQAEVSIPENVRVIAAEVFKDHQELKTLTLPDSLEVIGEEAFRGCSGLSSVNFGSGLRQIKDRAFLGCNFSTIRLPESVKELGLNAFDPEINLTYPGQKPQDTYENTAVRLSNEEYRGTAGKEPEAGVAVEGLEHASARLEGAQHQYTLTISEVSSDQQMKQAFLRNLHRELPEPSLLYDLHFTDKSNIPIKKLGKQKLTVMLPLPAQMSGEEAAAVQLDRNGQLETLTCQRVSMNGRDMLLVQMNRIEQIAVYGTGEAVNSDVLEMDTLINSLSPAPAPQEKIEQITPVMYLKWITGGSVLVLGLFLALKKVA